ncbi:hypothetical protein [Halomonas elongata]|uniref:Tip attachment protein J central straight fiber domain-containing protein n=1 Tax=Halomonas elongata (strain ATCC 33173 / DSM 2581 / NBRC 15536 / NCIMB 2198 / 1H9) TaxID=768066 RepID=E1V338_HALED|nr:hypothetical protein [Halomonas elongata]WBF19798.1 hypothetical protein LM502_08965 [Halomonas elongata]WPU48667.1 hypothetical protein SR933_07190 [Halomonas elongata DSM 2581]CBV42517.1 uncharacterized protein HELO_2633 [Halomonas elongata DSM 2581]
MAQKTRRRRALPPIDPQTDRRLRPFLEAVKEITETGDGVRGDPLDRKLTVRDLVDSGIGRLHGAGRGSSGVLLPGDAIDNDPAEDMAVPPRPTGFQAYGSFGYVALSWDIPGDLYGNHSFTSIYRAKEDNFANAVIIGKDSGMSYTDQVRDVAEDGVGYYYWITFTSSSGVEGPPNAPGGTYAEVIPDVRFIMQRITGQIDDGVLASTLRSKINLVVAPEDVEGSVNARLAAEADARRQAVASEARERAESIQRERKDWNAAIDAVTAKYDESIADLASKTEVLTKEDEALAQKIETAFSEVEKDFQAALRSERTAWTTKTDALGVRIDTTQAKAADNAADISETKKSLASKTSALTRSLESMTARLNATPVWSSNFEPGADFDRWKTASGGSIEAVSTAFAGNQAAVIRYNGSSPSSTGTTHSVFAEVTETLAKSFVGKRIRVEIYARKAQDNPASEFAVAYSTAANGNSGWHRFEPGDNWAPHEFMWDMPLDSSNAVDYIGIWGDTSNSGKGVEVDLITIRPATTEEDLPAITAAVNEEAEARVEEDKAITNRFSKDVSQLGENIAGVKETVSTEVARLDDRITSTSKKVDTTQSTLNGKVAAVETRMETRIEGIAHWSTSFEGDGSMGWSGGGSVSPASDSSTGSQSALFTWSAGSPSSGGRPGTAKAIPERTAIQFAGRRVRVTLDAKQPSSGTASEFAVAYSTSDVGNSGWHRFKPSGSWKPFSFLYDVPEANHGGRDFIGVWGDTSNRGNGILIDNMRIEVVADENDLPVLETMYVAKLQANGLIGGFGIYNDGETVEAGFDVDRFWLGRTNKNKVKPFIMDDDIVYLDTARIRQGDIQEGQLGPITIGKLTQNNGDPLTNVAGKIVADAIDVDNLRVAEAGKFYGDVYSGNYRSGSQGWAILQNGNVEFNQGVFNGTVEFKNIRGAGTLAGRDTVWWSEVTGGNRPSDNADRTADNTAKGIKNQGKLATKDKADYIEDVQNAPFIRLGINAYPEWKDASQYSEAHKKGTLIFEVSNGFGGWPQDNGGVITYWTNHNRAVQVFYGNGGDKEWVREIHPATYPNWSKFVQKEVFSSADVDALQTKNGPKEAGADVTGNNEAKSIVNQGLLATKNKADYEKDLENAPFVRARVNAYSESQSADQYSEAHKKGTLIFEVSNGQGGWPVSNGGVITHWSSNRRAVQILYGNGGGKEWVREVHHSRYPNWSPWTRREIFSSADVDALETKNGPRQAGADKTSENEAKRIAGQGKFATRDFAWWDEVSGSNKPHDNADVTGDNTSRDTSNVNGLPADVVRNGITGFGCDVSKAGTAPLGHNGGQHGYIEYDEGIHQGGGVWIAYDWNRMDRSGDPRPWADGIHFRIPYEVAGAFSGRRITVSVMEQRYSDHWSREFAVSYSTKHAGNSGWHRFETSTHSTWHTHSFEYDVPELEDESDHMVYIWPSTDNSGKRLGIKRITVTPSSDRASRSVDNWTRPNSTLIDGNKIYTGDAYVDTLQIKGNAITVPAATYKGRKGSWHYANSEGGWNWRPWMALHNFHQDDADIFIMALVPYSGSDSSSGGTGATATVGVKVRITIDGRVKREIDVRQTDSASARPNDDSYAYAYVTAAGTAVIGYRFPPYSGSRSIKIEVVTINSTIANCYMQALGVKR